MAYVVDPVFEADVFDTSVFTGVITDLVHEIRLSEKIIYLKEGTIQYHPVDNIYKEVRFHRAHDESLRVVDMPVIALGHDSKGAGEYTARLAMFKHGWRIAPANVSHTLEVTGEQITDDELSGSGCMDMTLFDPGVNVFVDYAPPDTELIYVDAGGLTPEQEARLEFLDVAVSSRSSHSAEDVTCGSSGIPVDFNDVDIVLPSDDISVNLDAGIEIDIDETDAKYALVDDPIAVIEFKNYEVSVCRA